MRVVFLLTQDRGGPADLTVSLARELAGRPGGPGITVMGPASLADAGCPGDLLVPLEVRSKTDLRGFRAVRALLAKLAPDVIHAQDRRAGLVASFAAGTATPVVLTFHGVPDTAAGRWVQAGPWQGRRPGVAGGSRMAADALVSRRVRFTVAPSRAMAAFLRRELRVPHARLRVVHNGVAVPAPRGPADGLLTFATLSSFAPCKATPVLVEAFLGLAAARPGTRLLMVGDGIDRAQCEGLARQSPAGRQVEFTGHRTDVDAQLGRADVFVLPSLNENLPLALLQAMAKGLPCIATAVGGVPEVLDSTCGVLVAPGDVAALRAAMTAVAGDPDLAARLGSAARQRVMQRFSLSRCADDHLRLWSEAVGGRR
ncbi:MAG TPA: glycosyltransferase family 4 protein [Streptosporangiaceae bacterium]|nr:glycosyltransferase family 4 protein [Streptosporangiaceae bacterium]